MSKQVKICSGLMQKMDVIEFDSFLFCEKIKLQILNEKYSSLIISNKLCETLVRLLQRIDM